MVVADLINYSHVAGCSVGNDACCFTQMFLSSTALKKIVKMR